jgi:hypothetical protein
MSHPQHHRRPAIGWQTTGLDHFENRLLPANLLNEFGRVLRIDEQHHAVSVAESAIAILGANGRNLTVQNRKAADEFAASLGTKLDADLMGRSFSEIARHSERCRHYNGDWAEILPTDGQELFASCSVPR